MLQRLGTTVLLVLSDLGELTLLAYRFFVSIFSTFKLTQKLSDQVYALGLKSLPATVITASFIGMAFSLQIVREFEKFGANSMVGGIVGLAIWRELGPLLTGVVVSGRIGAAISSELASMKVTEQVDALKTLSQDPVKYLVVPRILSTMIMMPILVGIADLVGFLSGLFIASTIAQINMHAYFHSASLMLSSFDIIGGLIKAVIFGFCIGLISCYRGLKAKGGAKGVGEATTVAVVHSLITIFVINYFLSLVLY
jgi:phospholipid/cholesterol/gamma-HCH transport system permease protein